MKNHMNDVQIAGGSREIDDVTKTLDKTKVPMDHYPLQFIIQLAKFLPLLHPARNLIITPLQKHH